MPQIYFLQARFHFDCGIKPFTYNIHMVSMKYVHRASMWEWMYGCPRCDEWLRWLLKWFSWWYTVSQIARKMFKTLALSPLFSPVREYSVCLLPTLTHSHTHTISEKAIECKNSKTTIVIIFVERKENEVKQKY